MKKIQHTPPGPERGRLRRAGAGRRGVTLIEVVAALGIMAVGIVGLLTLFPLGLEASARAGDHTTAAILGEYVIEQVRLRQDEIRPTDDTDDAIHALDWGDLGNDDYTYDSEDYTFEVLDPEHPHQLPGSIHGYGSGEMIMKQDVGELTDEELFSRYEVTLTFDAIEDNDAFTHGSGPGAYKDLMQVTVTVRWPRAFHNDARKNQETMTFVTYIRPKP